MTAAFFSARQYGADKDSRTSSSHSPAVGKRSPQLLEDVGEVPQDLNDKELERHIRDCGGRVLFHMAEWERFGNFADRGAAQYWLNLQNDAIRARSPAQVARMEKAQAKRMALEPGA